MAKSTTEIGFSGLQTWSGQILDEFLLELRGKKAYKVYDEMRKNSPIIAALLSAIELSIRKVSWTFHSDDGETDPRVELLDEARENLAHSWNDFITEALTMNPFGFAMFEIVYQRVGGRMLWRKFAPRGQDTVYKWNMDEVGDLLGVCQQAAPTYQLVDIPVEKLILFRTRVERNNPEGRSILRSAFVPYYYCKNIQQVEAIGIERDLAGLPHIKLPQGADTSDSDTSDAGVANKIVRNIRNDEQAGIVTPFGWEVELLSTGGSRQFDTDKIVRRYESRMLMSALAQFIMLGQDGVGSLALSRDATDFFVMAVGAVADIISETFTKQAIPRLLALNGYDADGVRLEHTPAGDVDTAVIADFLQKVGGMITWDANDELWLRQLIGLPERDPNELQGARDEQREMENARNKAILEQVRQRRTAQDGSEDEEVPTDEPAEEDEYSVSRFAANAPDDRKRRQMEKRLAAQIEKAMQRTRRKVMKYAREAKP